MAKQKVQITHATVRINKDLQTKVADIANVTGATISGYIEVAIAEKIKRDKNRPYETRELKSS